MSDTERAHVKALLTQMREYILFHGLLIGECVAWNTLKEMFGVGQSPPERARQLIDALNADAPAGKVLHGALQAAIIAKANSMVAERVYLIDHGWRESVLCNDPGWWIDPWALAHVTYTEAKAVKIQRQRDEDES